MDQAYEAGGKDGGGGLWAGDVQPLGAGWEAGARSPWGQGFRASEPRTVRGSVCGGWYHSRRN